MTTDQATQKHFVRMQLENMWKRYADKLRLEDHELVILAVPTYPANIEAVSALDLSDINDLMAVFAKHREDHPDELHQIKPSSGDAQDEAVDVIEQGHGGSATASAGEQVGPRDDGGGASEERAEPPAEPHEGYPSFVATELGDLTEALEQTLAEVRAGRVMAAGESMHNVDRSFGRWRRATAGLPPPPQLLMPAMSPEELLDLEREYTRSPGNITWVRDAKAVQDLMKQVPRPKP